LICSSVTLLASSVRPRHDLRPQNWTVFG
jgi:hypothetical protein